MYTDGRNVKPSVKACDASKHRIVWLCVDAIDVSVGRPMQQKKIKHPKIEPHLKSGFCRIPILSCTDPCTVYKTQTRTVWRTRDAPSRVDVERGGRTGRWGDCHEHGVPSDLERVANLRPSSVLKMRALLLSIHLRWHPTPPEKESHIFVFLHGIMFETRTAVFYVKPKCCCKKTARTKSGT